MLSSRNQKTRESPARTSLLNFKLSLLKARRHVACLKYYAAKQKIRITLAPFVVTEEATPEIPWNDIALTLTEYVNQVPVHPMPDNMKTKILSFLSRALVARWPQIFSSHLEDFQKHYQQMMNKHYIEQLLDIEHTKDLKEYRWEKSPLENGQYLENKMRFLKRKKLLKNRLLLTNMSARAVLEFTIEEFHALSLNFNISMPNRVGNLQGLQGRIAIPHYVLIKSIRKNVEEYNDQLRAVWYPSLICMLKPKIDKKKSSKRLFKCLEGLISRQFIEMKQNVLANLLKILDSERTIPLISFKVELKIDNIVVNPSFEALEEVYASMVHEIANLGVKLLPTLANELNPLASGRGKYLKLEMNKIYVGEFIADMKLIMRRTYKPILEYLEHFQNRYTTFISKNRNIKNELTNDQSDFQCILTRIQENSRLKTALELEPRNVYFPSAIIQMEAASHELLKNADLQKAHIVEELISQHMRQLREIYEDFEKHKSEIQKVPISTEELMVMRAFVSEGETQQRRERVHHMQLIGNQLLDITDLSEDHLELMRKTMNSLKEIEDVRASFAQLKHFEGIFKKHLKMITKTFQHEIENLAEKAKMFSKVHDSSKARENGFHEQNFFEKLNNLEDCASWIHKEEKLFGMPKRQFRILEEVREIAKNFLKSN